MKKYIVVLIIAILLVLGGLFILNKKKDNEEKPGDTNPLEAKINGEFNLDMIKVVNSRETGNYLISPYSIEIALNMLKEGAMANTYTQIDKVVPKRKITYFSVKDRISVANAIFIKESEKDNVSKEYVSELKNSYNAELIYDKFSTPNKINNWVNKKTYEMIPKILDSIPKDFVLGLANAVAIDVEWVSQFECIYTKEDNFETPSGTKKVEMMNKTYGNATYIQNESEEGIILPYMSYTASGEKDYANEDDSTRLEFIAIIPTNMDIRAYINDLTNESLNSILNSAKVTEEKEEVKLKLPRFEYDYSDDYFIDDLESLGIKDVFNPDLVNLNKMKSKSSDDTLYVSEAIHMTHISLNEKGTKAAAVTYFGVNKATAFMGEPKYINIEFNKPFMYMIRDSKTKEMLFFGVVEYPNNWQGNTCEN